MGNGWVALTRCRARPGPCSPRGQPHRKRQKRRGRQNDEDVSFWLFAALGGRTFFICFQRDWSSHPFGGCGMSDREKSGDCLRAKLVFGSLSSLAWFGLAARTGLAGQPHTTIIPKPSKGEGERETGTGKEGGRERGKGRERARTFSHFPALRCPCSPPAPCLANPP